MIFLALGSNLSSSFGDRFENINMAMIYLESYGINIVKKSHFYESYSYPNKKNPKFINIVISVKTHLLPVDLISVLLFIEEKLERQRNKKNDPRTCDIDIIDYKNQVLDFKYKNLNLTVHHKNLISRNFVLLPLQEVSPEWKHQITKENIGALVDKLSEEDKKSILKTKKIDIII